MSFNFTEKEIKKSKYDQDTFVGIFCVIAFIFTLLFILVPEKNIEKAGNDLDKFHSSLNLEWINPYLVKGYSMEDRVKKANDLSGKESIEDKMAFLLTVHSILMEQKLHKNRTQYLSQVMKDRRIIIDYLVAQFEDGKKTNFNCTFANCKDKEYKVTQEKLQTIKLVNLKLNRYYLDLINLYESEKKNKTSVEDIKVHIQKALTPEEQEQYQEMK